MEEIAKSDIFFFITALAVVVVTVILVVALYYLIKILRDVKKISSIAEREIENIADDARKTRGKLVSDIDEISQNVKESVISGKNIIRAAAAALSIKRAVRAIKKRSSRSGSKKKSANKKEE